MQCIRVAEKPIGSGAYTPSLKNTRYDNEHEGFMGSIGAAPCSVSRARLFTVSAFSWRAGAARSLLIAGPGTAENDMDRARDILHVNKAVTVCIGTHGVAGERPPRRVSRQIAITVKDFHDQR